MCFDYAELEDGRVVLNSTFNSESGGFINNHEYMVVEKENLEEKAYEINHKALIAIEGNELVHDPNGWNNGAYAFYEYICDKFELEKKSLKWLKDVAGN